MLILIDKTEYAVNEAADDDATVILGIPDAEKRGYVRRYTELEVERLSRAPEVQACICPDNGAHGKEAWRAAGS